MALISVPTSPYFAAVSSLDCILLPLLCHFPYQAMMRSAHPLLQSPIHQLPCEPCSPHSYQPVSFPFHHLLVLSKDPRRKCHNVSEAVTVKKQLFAATGEELQDRLNRQPYVDIIYVLICCYTREVVWLLLSVFTFLELAQ